MPARRFPPPWSVVQQDACFVVRDHNRSLGRPNQIDVSQFLPGVVLQDKAGDGSILMSEKPSALEMRLGGSFLKTVDEWRRKQKDLPSRAEAIRRLVERGLANQSPARQLSKGAKRKAAKMAGREIDRLGDQTATRAERARRKRRLIKGPREFRDIRYKTK